jgi:hypothetical protein
LVRVAVVDVVLSQLPQIAAEIATPMSKVEKLTMVAGENGEVRFTATATTTTITISTTTTNNIVILITILTAAITTLPHRPLSPPSPFLSRSPAATITAAHHISLRRSLLT